MLEQLRQVNMILAAFRQNVQELLHENEELRKRYTALRKEYDLMKKLPKEHWILYNIQIIAFGRNICYARSPKCQECFLYDLCKAKDKRK